VKLLVTVKKLPLKIVKNLLTGADIYKIKANDSASTHPHKN
jgi:hypothetical protein